MNPKITLFAKVFAVVLAGMIVGSVVNMGLITISGSIIPPPEGADMTTAEGITAAMPLLEPKHFIFPFLAHALGTLVGAFLAAYLAGIFAPEHKMIAAIVIGCIFFSGGMAAVRMIPAPMWFCVADLVLAYFPMAFLGLKLADRK